MPISGLRRFHLVMMIPLANVTNAALVLLFLDAVIDPKAFTGVSETTQVVLGHVMLLLRDVV